MGACATNLRGRARHGAQSAARREGRTWPTEGYLEGHAGARGAYTAGMRIALAVLLILHGLLHGLGFAKGLGLAALPQLTTPISRASAVLWLVAGLAMVATALSPWRWLYLVGAVAVGLSQVAIASAWADAKIGTLPNVIALVAVALSFLEQGPWSLAAELRADRPALVAEAMAGPRLETGAEALARLPAPVARYLRVSHALEVGRPRMIWARWRGRIRGSEGDSWMPFTAEQVSTYGRLPARLFWMRAHKAGLPVDVYHRFVGEEATFRARLLGAVPLAASAGPVMRRSETVTLLNDLCLLAPGHLLDPAIEWEAVDAQRARMRYRRGGETVSALLVFGAEGQLVDFLSEDRARSTGARFETLRWSTPLSEARTFGALRLPARGQARWHQPDGKSYAYVELELEQLTYEGQVPGAGTAQSSASSRSSESSSSSTVRSSAAAAPSR